MSQFILPSRATDANNNPLSGALLYFYLSGTTTPVDVFSDAERTTAHPNPVVADAGGLFAPIYTDPMIAYRATLKTAGGAPIADYDPYEGDELELSTVDDYGAIGDGATDNAAAFEAANAGASDVRVPTGTYYLASTPTLTKPLEVLTGADLTGPGAAPLGYTHIAGHQSIYNNTEADQFASRYMRRTADHVGGTFGYASAALRVDNYVSAGVTNFEWAGVFVCDNSATAGENVGVYGQGIKRAAAGPTWGAVSECIDYSTNPTSGVIGQEVNITANGTDNLSARVASDVAIRKRDTGGATLTVSWGYRIQNNGTDKYKTGYGALTGTRVEVGFDASNMTAEVGAFKMAASQPIIFSADNSRTMLHNGGAFVFQNGGVTKAQISDSGAYFVGTDQVMGTRRTGWAAATGTATRTTFATTTVTLPQLAERVKALIDDLTTHGAIGA